MNFIKKFFRCCDHDWELIKRYEIIETDRFWMGDDTPVGYRFVDIKECKKCGKILKQEIKI